MDFGFDDVTDSDNGEESAGEVAVEIPLAQREPSTPLRASVASTLPPPLPSAAVQPESNEEVQQYVTRIATLEAAQRAASVKRDTGARQIAALMLEIGNVHDDVVDALFQYEEELGSGHDAADKFGQSLVDWKERMSSTQRAVTSGALPSMHGTPLAMKRRCTPIGGGGGVDVAALQKLQATVAQLTAEKTQLRTQLQQQRDEAVFRSAAAATPTSTPTKAAAESGEDTPSKRRHRTDAEKEASRERKKLAKDLARAKTERARAKEQHQVWERRARETKDKYRERKSAWEKKGKEYEEKIAKLRAQRDEARSEAAAAPSAAEKSGEASAVVSAAAIGNAVATALAAAGDEERKRVAQSAAAARESEAAAVAAAVAGAARARDAAIDAAISESAAEAAEAEQQRFRRNAAASREAEAAAVAAALVEERARTASAADPLRETVDNLQTSLAAAQSTLGDVVRRAGEAERELAMRTASEARLEASLAALEASHSDVQSSLAALEASHTEVKGESSAAHERLTEEHRSALADATSAREAACTEFATREAAQRAAIEVLETKERELAAEVARVRGEVDAAQTHGAALSQERDALGAANTELASQLAAEKARGGSVHGELTATKAALATCAETRRALRGGLAALGVEAKALRATTTALAGEARASLGGAEAVALFSDAAQRINAKSQEAMAEMVEKFLGECAKRRKLFNELQELRGNIRVICRCRPISRSEAADGCEAAVSVATAEGRVRVTRKGRKHTFDFDHAFGPAASNGDVYSEVSGLITSVLDGFNVCIFAYGQTGTGKTFTMMGPDGGVRACPDPALAGLNQRALDDLFSTVAERSSGFGAWSITVSVSVLEVYNEEVRAG